MKNSFRKHLVIPILLWILFVAMVSDVKKGTFLLVVIVFIPMSLLLVPTIKRSGESSVYHGLLLKVHPIFAIAIGLACVFPEGRMVSGICSLVWLLYAVVLFGYGVRRFLERGWYRVEECAVDISFLYALIGGIVFTLYCFDPHTVVIEKANYFYVAMLVPLFTGWLGRELPFYRKVSSLYRWIVSGLIVSPLIMGIGMLSNVWVESVGWLLYTVSLFGYCYYAFSPMENVKTVTKYSVCISSVLLFATAIIAIIDCVFRLQAYIWMDSTEWLLFYTIPLSIGLILGLFGWYYQNPIEKNGLYQLPQTNINGGWYIGKDFLQENGYEAKVASHAGIIQDLKRLKRSDLLLDQLHPKVFSWLESTSLYDVSLEAHWEKHAWLFEKCHKAFSNKIQQANIPSPHEGVVELDSKIVSLINHEDFWKRNLNAWICSYKHTDETYILGIFSEHEHDNERYIHYTMPIPKCNRTTIYRLEHGANGSLQITSVPRRGGMGDEGHYIMTKNFSFRFPFNENLVIWVDEYGRLQMTHRFWFMGIKVVTLEYEMIAK
jgi:hypothetical protein